MSIIKLIQRIKETSQALQHASDIHNEELVETLEDELYELEEELEEEQKFEYDDNHTHGWY